MSKVNEELKKSGVFNVKYYYKNKPLIGNIFTVCALLSEDNKILARGISIRSVLDAHNKKTARRISRNRALSAFFKQKKSDPICYDEIETVPSIKRSFKFKSEEDKEKLINDARNIGLNVSCSTDNKMWFYLPYSYPMNITKNYFDWKSEFNPTATEDEKKIFRIEE